MPQDTPCYFAGTDGGLFRSSDVMTRVPDNANADSATLPHFEARLGRGLATHLAYSIATDLHDSSSAVMLSCERRWS